MTMNTRRLLRPFAYRLADLLEAGAGRLRKAVERKRPPPPLRLPTEAELLMARLARESVAAMFADAKFYGGLFERPVWQINLSDGPPPRVEGRPVELGYSALSRAIHLKEGGCHD